MSEALVTRCPTCGIDWELDEGNIPFAFQARDVTITMALTGIPISGEMLRILDINTYKQYKGYQPRRKASKS